MIQKREQMQFFSLSIRENERSMNKIALWAELDMVTPVPNIVWEVSNESSVIKIASDDEQMQSFFSLFEKMKEAWIK